MDALQHGLGDYRAVLGRHLALVAAELQQLEPVWQALDHVFQGEAAEAFRQRWLGTCDRLRQFLEEGARIERELEVRVAALDSAASSRGL